MARTRRPPARTTCRSPCTHASAAVAPGGRSHSPKSILLPFDRADLVEDHGLVMAHLLPAAEGAGVGFGQVHVQDVSRLDLPSDRDAVHGDRHLLALTRSVETLLPASDRLDPAEGPSILTHERLPGSDAPAFTRMPSSWVSTWTCDSFATSLRMASTLPFAARRGAPATARSRPLPRSLTPAAADTLGTESNRSCGSRISSRGFGLSSAFTFVVPGRPAVPKTIVSPFDNVPS